MNKDRCSSCEHSNNCKLAHNYNFCEECKQYEQIYAEEINKQQEEFLRKEEPYLYD